MNDEPREPSRSRRPQRVLAFGIVIGLCGGLLAVGTCRNRGGDDDNVREPPATAESSSTTSADEVTTTTTVATEGPPEWVDVVLDLYQRRFSLLAEPDPSRVVDVYAETCACWEQQLAPVEALVAQGNHVEGQAANVLFVKYEQTDPRAGFVDLTVKVRANPLRIVDSTGSFVQDLPAPADASCVALSLLPDGADSAYRIHTELPLPDCPEGS